MKTLTKKESLALLFSICYYRKKNKYYSIFFTVFGESAQIGKTGGGHRHFQKLFVKFSMGRSKRNLGTKEIGTYEEENSDIERYPRS